MRLSEYLIQFPRKQYGALLADDISRRAGKLLPALGRTSSGQYILECSMSGSDACGDFSIQITRSDLPGFIAALENSVFREWCSRAEAWARFRELCLRWDTDPQLAKIEDVWLEFDYEALGAEIPLPCIFIGARKIDIEDALKGPVRTMLGDIPPEETSELLKRCFYALPEIGFFQLGAMLSRKENPRSVRLFTNDLTFSQVIPFLSRAGWGNRKVYAELEDFIQWAQNYSDGLYLLDFGVSPDGVSGKLGICFAPPPGELPLAVFLAALVKRGWALPEKCGDVRSWVKRNDFPSLINSISHFKFSFEGRILGAKVYLRNEPLPTPIFHSNSRW